jgi:hypothetical protein
VLHLSSCRGDGDDDCCAPKVIGGEMKHYLAPVIGLVNDGLKFQHIFRVLMCT